MKKAFKYNFFFFSTSLQSAVGRFALLRKGVTNSQNIGSLRNCQSLWLGEEGNFAIIFI